jgi:membrane-associated phospholipid phosphatase
MVWLVWAVASAAFAQEGAPSAPPLRPFGTADAIVTSAALGWAAIERLRPSGSWSCRWCDSSDGRDTLWGVDRGVRDALRWSDRNKADRISGALLGGSFVLPVVFIGTSGRTGTLRDGALVFEAAAITAALTQTAKKVFHRPRPYVHRGDAPPGTDPAAEESHVSFFSGHASMTFALGVSTGSVALLRGEKNAGWVLGTGLAVAATTSYLRVAAERHYFSDVLVGAAVGSTIGWLVPHLHRPAPPPPESPSTAVSLRSSAMPLAAATFAAPGRLGGEVAVGVGAVPRGGSVSVAWTH